MAAESLNSLNMRLHVDGLAKEVHRPGPLLEGSSQRPHRLIAGKDHRALRPPQIVFQMMADTPRITHSRRGNDDLGPGIKVDSLGLLAAHRQLQPWEGNGVNPLLHQCPGLVVIAAQQILRKHMGGLHRQRTVHVDLKIIAALHHTVVLDFPDKI